VLQRIKVRHRRVEVNTTLFWRVAVEETRARVLLRRFRHPYAFALIALLSAFLWIAFAGKKVGAEGQPYRVLLIDGSGATATRKTHEDQKEAALAWAKESDSTGRRILWCGATTRTLLAPGEEWSVFERRIEACEPERAGSTLLAALKSLLLTQSDSGMDVDVLTSSDLDLSALGALPKRVHVALLKTDATTQSAHSRILSLGLGDAQSADYGSVDAFVSAELVFGHTLTATLDRAPLALRANTETGAQHFWLRDLPARGGLLRVATTPNDPNALDQVAERRLPQRSPTLVYVEEPLQEALHPIILADAALRLSDESEAQVLVCNQVRANSMTPQLSLVDSEDQEHTFLLKHDTLEDSHLVLLQTFKRLGLDALDTDTLAQEMGAAITLGAEPAPVRGLTVWREILTGAYDFRSSRSFPLFFAMGIRWLSSASEVEPVQSIGRPLAERTHHQPGSDAFSRGTGFNSQLQPHGPATTSQLDAQLPLLTMSPTGTPFSKVPLLEERPARNTVFDLGSWLAALALLMLVFEWFLYRSGRIP
jgi:hypothetical protein